MLVQSHVASMETEYEMCFAKIGLKVKEVELKLTMIPECIFLAKYNATNRMSIFCLMVDTSNTISPNFIFFTLSRVFETEWRICYQQCC